MEMEMEMEMEREVEGLLQHPFHKHPLVLLLDGQENHYSSDDDKQHSDICSGCSAPILPGAQVLVCSENCGSFILHKSCGELPMEIIDHFWHKEHPLALLAECPYRNGINRCNHCTDKIKKGFVYHCSVCKFDLDVICASSISFEESEMEFKHPSHSHPLIPVDDDEDKPLNGCAGCSAPILSGPIFLCSKKCGFVSHKSCLQPPLEITHFLHADHPLSLLAESPYEDRTGLCHHCNDTIDKGFFYHCSACQFDLDLACASMPAKDVEAEFNHPFHKHPLLPVPEDKQKYEDRQLCSGCSVTILSGSIFICIKKCGFLLHKSCAELPMEITDHFLHVEHPLALRAQSPVADGIIGSSCDHCRDTIKGGFVYRCFSCDFHLDISCASMSAKEVEMELAHPFHKHPLIKIGEKNHEDSDQMMRICSGCESPILSGPILICTKQQQQCKFVLHKSCAELPMEITHFSHTQHPLTLLHEVPPYYEGGVSCDYCKEHVNNSFFYHCSICKFDLDVVCASLKSSYPELEAEEDHKHKLVMINPSLFNCDICGKESKGRSYVCITCRLRVHPTCSSLPRIVKFFTHSCPLKLTFGHQLERPIDKIKQFCRMCFDKLVDTKFGFYYCLDCDYIADIDCTNRSKFRDYEFDPATYSPSRRYKDEGKIDLQKWHEHGLALCNEEPSTTTRTDGQEMVCRGCVEVISSAPFYECKEKCGYFLHESCANLYVKIRHPFHPNELHDLLLLHDSDFYCFLCGLCCNGFKYFCKQKGCEVYEMDIRCALRTLRSEVIYIEKAHRHPLRIVSEGEHYDKQCKGCSSGCYRARYSCPDPGCDYNLCERCVGLPASAKHSWDEHPLELTYESTRQHELDGEYYCDQCEEPRDRDHWFYHCATCERDVHTECMGLHNLNLTITSTLDLHPGHSVKIVGNPQVYPICTECGLACKDLYFQCLDCEFRAHYWECPTPNC